jgi:hypothetical protein
MSKNDKHNGSSSLSSKTASFPSTSKTNGLNTEDELSRVREIILGQYKEEQSSRHQELEEIFQDQLKKLRSETQTQLERIQSQSKETIESLKGSIDVLNGMVRQLKEAQAAEKVALLSKIDDSVKNLQTQLAAESSSFEQKILSNMESVKSSKVDKKILADVFDKITKMLTD